MTKQQIIRAAAEWPDNIVADRHEVTGKWVLMYLTDKQADACKAALAKLQSISEGE